MEKIIVKAVGCLSIAVMVAAIVIWGEISSIDKGFIALIAVLAIAVVAVKK